MVNRPIAPLALLHETSQKKKHKVCTVKNPVKDIYKNPQLGLDLLKTPMNTSFIFNSIHYSVH